MSLDKLATDLIAAIEHLADSIDQAIEHDQRLGAPIAEQQIDDLKAAVEAGVEAGAAAAENTEEKKPAPRKKRTRKAAKKPDPEPAPEEEETEDPEEPDSEEKEDEEDDRTPEPLFERDDVKNMLMKVAEVHGRDKVAELLASVDATALKFVEEDDYEKLIDAARETLD